MITAAPMVKLEKKLGQLRRKENAIFQLPDSDPVWKDTEFWKTTFIRLVDRQAELVEHIAYIKTNGNVGSLP